MHRRCRGQRRAWVSRAESDAPTPTVNCHWAIPNELLGHEFDPGKKVSVKRFTFRFYFFALLQQVLDAKLDRIETKPFGDNIHLRLRGPSSLRTADGTK